MVEGAQRLIGTALVLGALAASTQASAQKSLEASGSCRDGLPHGAYQLRASDGTLRAAGAFNRGKRTSSFMFWSSRGVRIAQIPYDEGQWSGTVSLWYADAARGRDPQVKLEAAFAAGKQNGETRAWHPNGRLRALFLYEQGVLVDAKAWSPAGVPLTAAAARALAIRDAETDARYYETLEAIVNAHLPRCDDAPAALRSATDADARVAALRRLQHDASSRVV
ncbi:MAG TPA: hypothetical protein VFO33_06175 [Casimicrobiaceae bacterium]|nr:hypothetical protein [Casimicrobiaceae bacterium]